jgi:hypothetical protein
VTVLVGFSVVTGVCVLMFAVIALVLVYVSRVLLVFVFMAVAMSVFVVVSMAMVMGVPQPSMFMGVCMAMLVGMLVRIIMFVRPLHVVSPFDAAHGPNKTVPCN